MLETIVFVCGACVMVLEMVGSRVMAPYLGTSVFVWTSLIGVILGCLSLGYWFGGQLADKYPSAKSLAWILFISGLFVALIAVAGDPVLYLVQTSIRDIRVGAVIATTILFGIPGVLLGAVSPLSVRLKLHDVNKTGQTAGALYALSTLGSIVGTFLTGFYLIAVMSHRSILLMIAAALTLLCPLALKGRAGISKTLIAWAVIAFLSAQPPFLNTVMGQGFIETQTAYNRVWIYDAFMDTRPVRVLQLNDTGDSAAFIGSDDLAFEYTRYFRLGKHFHPEARKALMIGGGAYSYPKYFLKEFPEATMDVVEIDPKLTEIAQQHFGFKKDARIRIFHEDARTYLNRVEDKYDIVYTDVFKSYSIPFQLATEEAMKRIHDRLNEDGIVVMNVISSLSGPNSPFLRALMATLEPYFPQVLIFAVQDPAQEELLQNLVIVAFKNKTKVRYVSDDPSLNQMISHIWPGQVTKDLPPMRDGFAPVEKYAENLIVHHPTRSSGYLQKKMQNPEIK